MGQTGDKTIELDISKEMWREYEWIFELSGEHEKMVYRINEPQKLFIRPGGSTHRVVDSDGVSHCLPSVGVFGCVLRWENFDKEKPVNF